MPRPKQVAPRQPLSDAEVRLASYVGSAEHKTKRWWGGLPEAYVGEDGTAKRPKKQTTTICHLVETVDRDRATDWVREALHRCQFRFFEGDKTYPKHIWYREEAGSHWFGFCTNGIAGTYKGWPISEAEKRELFG